VNQIVAGRAYALPGRAMLPEHLTENNKALASRGTEPDPDATNGNGVRALE